MELIYCTELPQYLEQDPKKVMTLDIETTGFVPPQDEILSLAIIDGNENTLFYEKFKPEHTTVWPEAQAVNGISPEEVSNCLSIRDYANIINTTLAEASVVIGYNHYAFDLPFLAYSNITLPPETPVIDVMLDYAELNGEWDEKHQGYKWKKLTDCAEHYQYQYHAHDSLEDAKATLHCAKECARELQARSHEQEANIEFAKNLIGKFCESEYSGSADFSDYHHISLAYTTTEDESHCIQVEADLVECSMNYLVDNNLVHQTHYPNLQAMIEQKLSHLNFDDLIFPANNIIHQATTQGYIER